MVFTDLRFFFFFAIAFSVYWMLQKNAARKLWLLGCSVFFYAVIDWRFLGIVLFVILNTYATTLLLTLDRDQKFRHSVLTVGVTLSLGVLGLFKYYNFFADSFSSWISTPRIEGLLLPVGISFYTFHSISYMIDSYRRRIIPTTNVGDVALYILFFPQLVAGPIVRATDLFPQMRTARHFAEVPVRLLLTMFFIGYCKKACISDNLAPFVDTYYSSVATGKYGFADGIIAALFYSVQIYCDFSGYTDMAIASAGLLGYQLRPNFDAPYLSSNLIEFWRRWHISLSSFLRDYLYIPLGGSHGSAIYKARNIFVTMLLGGLWHGAAWTFVLWGAIHGAGLVVCHAWQKLRKVNRSRQSFIGTLLTFLFVTAAWVFFRSPDIQTALYVFNPATGFQPPTLIAAHNALIIFCGLALLHIAVYRFDLESWSGRLHPYLFAMGYGLAVSLALPFVNLSVQPFIYFQF